MNHILQYSYNKDNNSSALKKIEVMISSWKCKSLSSTLRSVLCKQMLHEAHKLPYSLTLISFMPTSCSREKTCEWEWKQWRGGARYVRWRKRRKSFTSLLCHWNELFEYVHLFSMFHDTRNENILTFCMLYFVFLLQENFKLRSRGMLINFTFLFCELF